MDESPDRAGLRHAGLFASSFTTWPRHVFRVAAARHHFVDFRLAPAWHSSITRAWTDAHVLAFHVSVTDFSRQLLACANGRPPATFSPGPAWVLHFHKQWERWLGIVGLEVRPPWKARIPDLLPRGATRLGDARSRCGVTHCQRAGRWNDGCQRRRGDYLLQQTMEIHRARVSIDMATRTSSRLHGILAFIGESPVTWPLPMVSPCRGPTASSDLPTSGIRRR